MNEIAKNDGSHLPIDAYISIPEPYASEAYVLIKLLNVSKYMSCTSARQKTLLERIIANDDLKNMAGVDKIDSAYIGYLLSQGSIYIIAVVKSEEKYYAIDEGRPLLNTYDTFSTQNIPYLCYGFNRSAYQRKKTFWEYICYEAPTTEEELNTLIRAGRTLKKAIPAPANLKQLLPARYAENWLTIKRLLEEMEI